MKTCSNAILAFAEMDYHPRHIAIITGYHEDRVCKIIKEKPPLEPTLKFLTLEQKQRWLVLQKLLSLKPVSPRWDSNDYYYISILKFLLIPREQVYEIYKHAPLKSVAKAYKEKSPYFKKFDYTAIGVTSEEYKNFVLQCYNIINDPTKWR